MAEGWIKLYRQIRGHVFFKQKRTFSRFEAWVDILLEANHCDKPWIVGNEVITVERGSFVTSDLKLMNRWGWSKTKVRAFLKLLQDEKMIVKNSDSKKTTISVVNYGVYQSEETAEELQKNHKKTAKKLQKNTTKNVKNVKNDKKVIKDIYMDFVQLAPDEYQKLITELGETATKEYIERLNDYAHQKPKKFNEYKSHYHTIKNWHRKDKSSLHPKQHSPDGKPIPRAYSSIQDAVERMKQK